MFDNDDEQSLRFLHFEEKFGYMMKDNNETINEKQIDDPLAIIRELSSSR